ncbi:MAG TPA: GPW/gp25 family protein [Saprospiraceae bacterium]|nr:GPW/gp25 family protein [Saprospiraceae bacterium]
MADEIFFTDLKVTNRDFDQQISDRDGVSLLATAQKDLATVNGRTNLAQAVINRLLTRKGELLSLGHPDYGSRLYELVGEQNNIRVQGLAEIYIRESLAQETRIESITGIAFAPINRQQGRHELRIQITIKPVGSAENLTLILPVNL